MTSLLMFVLKAVTIIMLGIWTVATTWGLFVLLGF
jgi:hypothetical protein